MVPETLLFNLLLAAVVAGAWKLTRARALGIGLIAGMAALILATWIGRSGFDTMRLLAWAFFGQAPLVALLLARQRWRAGARRLAGALAALAVALVAVAVDAFVIEPRSLVVTTHRVAAPGLTAPVRVALLADIQTDHVGEHERRALAAVAAAEPDLVLLAGDYVQVADPIRRHAELVALRETWRAAGIAPGLGTIAVKGNADPPGWERAFEGLPVIASSQTHRLRLGEITVTALAEEHSFDTGLLLPPAPGFHIALGHAPDYSLSGLPADLMLAGHVHGGQVQLPWIGPLITFSAVSREQAVGRTDLPDGRTLIVSRGIGMERVGAPRLRFLCRPEIVLIDLVPAPPREGGQAPAPAAPQ
jgi:predicted MPP superfamily phosphohydrolase